VRVAIIPTGMMELRGLCGCLARLFSEHDFVEVPRVPARPGRDAEPFSQSFTARQRPSTAADVPTNLAKLVQELGGQVYPRRRDAADLAVVVDDLELFNIDQPATVVEAVRQAVRSHVERAALPPQEKVELARCLRERASFHLAVPMTEAWFFADAQSIARNGVPADRSARLRPSVDPESFETEDALFSADDGTACATMANRNRRRHEDRRPPWIITPQADAPWFVRERHPKAYLQWLCRDPSDNWCTSWRESKAGAEALRELSFGAVLANPSHCAYIRALIDDLADALGEPAPFDPAGVIAPLTSRKRPEAKAALRNL
jgi:hypothetical protein